MDYIPLAERLRPSQLEEIVGQEHLTGPSGLITRLIHEKKPLSIVLFGPPGSGKTSIARIYAKAFNMRFMAISAVSDGIAELKKLVKEISDTPLFGRSVLLFVDEIHRFNKAQQDVFLPLIEKGTIILVGATAENPSFYLNPALLSRVRVLALNPLEEKPLAELLSRYEKTVSPLPLEEDARKCLLNLSQGDGRYLMNLIENLEHYPKTPLLDEKALLKILQRRAQSHDKKGDHHYNLISSLHKSVRGSDPDAALYWFTRMIEGGEEPLFIARRVIRMASEDVGLADPEALKIAISALHAYQTLGSPEGELAIAEAIVYLALAPKSNALYVAYNEALARAKETGHLMPPKIILNAPTSMMKELEYGKGYAYDHDTKNGFSGQNYFPDHLERESFYRPVERGFEREMSKRLNYFNTKRLSQNHEC